MISAETHIATPSASKYLQQLCKHWSHKFAVVFTPDKGRVPFGDNRAATFEATPETLTMRIEAADEETLTRLQNPSSSITSSASRFAKISATSPGSAPPEAAYTILIDMSGRPSILHSSTSPLHDRPDILRRAGIDDVAGLQLEGLRQLGDLLGDAPDHLARASEFCFTAPLTASEIAPLVKWPILSRDGSARSRAAWSKLLPISHGFFSVAHLALQIAPRHVEADGVAVDMIERLARPECCVPPDFSAATSSTS